MRCLVFLAGAALAAGAAGPEPCLVFGPAELPPLRNRVQNGANRAQWEALRARAEGLCTPGNPDFSDPEAIDAPREGVRIQILAHFFGRALTRTCETLGFAYQLSGEKRYAAHGGAVLAAAARKLPPGDARIARSFAGARGDMMRGFAIGLDWLGETLPEDQRRAVEETAAEYVRVILAERAADRTWWVPYHNFMGVALGAAGCLAIRLKERFPAEAQAWVQQCAEGVRLWLDNGFDEEGAGLEGTLYAEYGLSNAVLFAHALRRNGGQDLFDHPRLRRVPQFFAQSLLPGEGVFDARNDASYMGFSDPFMLRLADAHGSGLAAWLWERCGSPGTPLALAWQNAVAPCDPLRSGVPLAQHFPGRGLCTFRTGWGAADVLFAIEAGAYRPVTHNQADKGHFTLYGLGRRWAIDSGYGNNRLPGGRDQTVAHNAVLIDGEGQALSGAGAGTSGRMLRFEDNPRRGYVLCDAADAYNRNDKGQPGAGVRHALRHALFVRPSAGAPAYAVVLDDIRKDDQPREYAWLLHTEPGHEVRVAETGVFILPPAASGAAFVETPLGAAGRGACEWGFTLPQPGRVSVWARVRVSGPEPAKADSFFVSVDGGTPIPWHMPGAREWTWARVTNGVEQAPVAFTLAAGEHRLRFATRESGAQVDAVLVTADPDLAPPFARLPPGTALLEAESGTVTEPMRVVREEAGPGPRFRLLLHAAAPVRIEADTYDGHPRVIAAVRAPAPEFAAVMLPLPPECPDPPVRFERTGEGLLIAVGWPGRTDRILWPDGGDRVPQLLGE